MVGSRFMSIEVIALASLAGLYVVVKVVARLTWNPNKLIGKRPESRTSWTRLGAPVDMVDPLLKLLCRAYLFDEEHCYRISPEDNLKTLYVLSGRTVELDVLRSSISESMLEEFNYSWPVDEDWLDSDITFAEVLKQIVKR